MNERIRQLAEQATDKWLGGEFFDKEKFAELIVQECIDVGIKEFHNYLPNVFPANAIKKAFRSSMMHNESHLPVAQQSLVFRLRKRAEIRRQIPGRKSVEEGARDRIADLLEEAANEIEKLIKENQNKC